LKTALNRISKILLHLYIAPYIYIKKKKTNLLCSNTLPLGQNYSRPLPTLPYFRKKKSNNYKINECRAVDITKLFTTDKTSLLKISKHQEKYA
jgi:hypothetical protein